MRGKKLKLGDIYEIPLPNGKNAYGRLFKEGTLAIYDLFCDSVQELPQTEQYRFFVPVYEDLLRDGKWKIVDSRKFNSDEEAWPPPFCAVDQMTHIGSIYYKGQILPCKYDDCKDLEIAAVWDRHHLVDRLMGDNKWTESLGHPIKPDEKQ